MPAPLGAKTLGNPSCYRSGTSLKCVSKGISAGVTVYCDGGYRVSASIPAKTSSRCTRGLAVYGATQRLFLYSRCDTLGYLIAEPSYILCPAGSKLLRTEDDGTPFCYNQATSCQIGGTSQTCKATIRAVGIAGTRWCVLYDEYI